MLTPILFESKQADASQLDLSGTWSFAFAPGNDVPSIHSIEDWKGLNLRAFPCTVPGNFELDLCSNGLFEGDPFFGTNIAELRKFETYHVWYFRKFEFQSTSDGRAILRFEGIDCISDIYLNGRLIGSTDNMLIEHEFDVTDALRLENEILVHIRPVGERAVQYPYPPSVTTMPHLADSTYIRKAPHCFGWDIMPRALSAGLWRPVSIEVRATERVDWVYLATTELAPDLSSASLLLRYQMELPVGRYDAYDVELVGHCGSSEFQLRKKLLFRSGQLEVKLENPSLWWPKDHGEANLYEVEVRLLKDGVLVDTKSFRHGIRWVWLDRTDTTDEAGSGEFCFHINHERIFAKGTNWVPLDPYHSRDLERIPKVFELVDEIGCNMIRCWGGNVYENDLLYDLCDEKGILIWQDFAMACGVYPQDADFCQRLSVEARAVIRRLRNHPSLVLWAGDNECDEAWAGSRLGLEPNDNRLTRQVLPDVLREEDPVRPYLPSSPYLSRENRVLGTSSMPEAHLWGIRHDHRASYFKEANCHFISEVGFLSCPAVSSMRRFIPEESLWPYADNPFWKMHATSPIPGVNLFDYRVNLLAHEVQTFFGQVPDNLEDFVFATQVVQAEAMKFIIERFRSQMWRRTGILWWNIMDGWPQFSDAVVDYYFQKKLAYSFIQRAQWPLCLVMRDDVLVAVNDFREERSLYYTVTNMASKGVLLEGEAVAQGNGATTLGTVPNPMGGRGLYQIKWIEGGETKINHFSYGETPYDLRTYRNVLQEIYPTCSS